MGSREGMQSNSTAGADWSADTAETTVWDYVALLRRRWWLPVVLAVVAGVGTASVDRFRGDVYTARALLQKKEESSPLEAFARRSAGSPPADMGSQLEILRSASLLGTVVDSLGLQLSVTPAAARSRLFSSIHVDAAAPPGAYVVQQSGTGVVLASKDGARLGTAAPGGVLVGPGFRVQIADVRAANPAVQVSIRDFDAAVDALRHRLSLDQPPTTNLLRVTYRAGDPQVAASVVNAVSAVYRADSDQRARAEASRRRLFLASQLAAVADSLASAQASMADYQEKARILDPKSEGETLANGLFQAEGDARTLRFQESVLASLLTSLQAKGASDAGLRRIVAISSELLPNGAELYRRLQDLESQRAALTASPYGYTARGGRVQVLDSLIGDTKQEMRSVVEQSLSLIRSRREDADARVGELQTQVGGLPTRATAFGRLAQRSDAVQKTFDMLAGKYYEAQVAEAVASGDVAILDPARVPLAPDARHAGRNLALALLVGALAGFAAAVLLEQADTTIHRRGDAERATRSTVIGLIPVFGKREERGAGDYGPSKMDAFRAVRTTLRFLRAENPKHIAVTSQGPGEGKSFTASNLALAMAQHGSVLLIDADLRRPTVHRRFGIDRTPGVTDVLVGEAALTEAIVHLPSGLAVLPAGTMAPDPGGLLDQPNFQRLRDAVARDFQTVIVDTAPLLAAPETLDVARGCDGVLFVAVPNVTKGDALSEAAGQLRGVAATLLGVILNRVPVKTGAYGKYYRYYGYGKYYRDGRESENGKKAARAFSSRRLMAWRRGTE